VPAAPLEPPLTHAVVDASTVAGWLAELGLTPVGSAEREGVTSWDLVLDGRQRFDLRITVILDPAVGLVTWAHLAPPIRDSFRRTYRRLLRWNDSYPFTKFGITEDERAVISTEIPVRWLTADELGLALARSLAVCDLLLEEAADLVWIGGRVPPTEGRTSRGEALLARYADRLAELSAG
jgi:hypothetical protein